MKVVVNRCYGGFSVSKEVVELLGLKSKYSISNTDERLISLIEEKGSEFCSGGCAELEIVEVPEEATDWEVSEYDGSEEIICVVDGKLKHL